MSVILLGYRGAGKTSIGRRLADQLWQSFVDTDELVIAAAGGSSIREIFERDGEPRFRAMEVDALRDACARADHVIATGGGAILNADNRAAMKRVASRIYLKCDPQTLHARIHTDPNTIANRPALTHVGGTLAEVEQMLMIREPLYREVATAELDATNLSIEEAVVRVVKLM